METTFISRFDRAVAYPIQSLEPKAERSKWKSKIATIRNETQPKVNAEYSQRELEQIIQQNVAGILKQVEDEFKSGDANI